MMKKFQLKGLRFPLQRRSKAAAADRCDTDDDIDGDSAEVRGNGGLTLACRQQGSEIEEGDDLRRELATDLENLEVSLPKKREKTGLLKTIRNRISTIHKKRDSATGTAADSEDDDRGSDRCDRRARVRKHKTSSFKVSRPIQKPVRSSHSEECLELSDVEEIRIELHHSARSSERNRPDLKIISFGRDLHSLRSDFLKSREGAQISRSSSPKSSSREGRAPPTAPRPPLRSSKNGKDSKSKPATQSESVMDIHPDYEQIREVGPMWSLTAEIFRLSKYGWYWGPITRVEAEEKLADQSDGAFLVRDSSDERYLLSLSFRSYGRTLHTRIEHCNGMFSFYAQPESEGYTSIVDLIEHSMTDSESGVFCYSRARMPGAPSFPVRLTKPVSRFTQVRSLQYLCRFVIRQYTRFDHIQKLPLPSRIIGWLSENQY